MEKLIKRVQEQLDNNWCVSADDIQEMVGVCNKNASKKYSTMQISKGKCVVIFDSDMEDKIKKYNWYLGSHGYVMTSSKECEYNYMHQLVMGFKGNGQMSPDHINRVKTDNRRSNLRVISQSDNVKNRVVRKDTIKGKCLTKKEEMFMRYCISHVIKTNVFPTFREIQDEFDFKSPNSVTQYLKSIVSKGVFERDDVYKYKLTDLGKDIFNKESAIKEKMERENDK